MKTMNFDTASWRRDPVEGAVMTAEVLAERRRRRRFFIIAALVVALIAVVAIVFLSRG